MKRTPDFIFRTVYAYGSFETGRYGFLTLRRDGRVGHYEHPNEHSFVINDSTLFFENEAGRRSGKGLLYNLELKSFFCRDNYLVSAVSLGEAVQSTLTSVFINTIPKSGTYLFEALLFKLGFAPVGLHLSDEFYDDNRGVPSNEFHAAPHLRRVTCPAAPLVSLLSPGESAVGHVASVMQLRDIGKQCCLIQLVRNLRHVLVSMYRFKQRQVIPLDPSDTLWRTLAEPERFLGFLIHSETRDIAFIGAVASGILESRIGLVLRYEDLLSSSDTSSKISEALEQPQQAVASELRHALASPTSTLSSSPVDTASVNRLWNDNAEDFFRSSGLFALNERLGYENRPSTQGAAF